MMTHDEILWLAGWLEGEGTFFFSERASGSNRITIQVFSVDRDVIEKAAEITGGAIYFIKKRPPSRPGWRLNLESQLALDVMIAVQPYMCSRRQEQIRVAIKDWTSRWNKPSEKPCACGCGEIIIAGPRKRYVNRTHVMRGRRKGQRVYKPRRAA